jgi:hypothetical protein
LEPKEFLLQQNRSESHSGKSALPLMPGLSDKEIAHFQGQLPGAILPEQRGAMQQAAFFDLGVE